MRGMILPALSEFLTNPIDLREHKRRHVLDFITLSGDLLKAALADLQSQSFSPESGNYANALKRESAWRENISKDFPLDHPENSSVSEWLSSPKNANDLKKIISSILQSWKKILDEINSSDSSFLNSIDIERKKEVNPVGTRFLGSISSKREAKSLPERTKSDLKKAIELHIRRECVEVVSESILKLTKVLQLDVQLERELLESFSSPEEFKIVMKSITDRLLSFLPSECCSLFEWQSWSDWTKNPTYFEGELFCPLLIQRNYIPLVVSASPTPSQLRSSHDKLSFSKLPEHVQVALETSLYGVDSVTLPIKSNPKEAACIVLMKTRVSTKGMCELFYHLSPAEMKSLFNNPEFQKALNYNQRNNFFSRNTHERGVFELFLKIMSVHANLADSKRGTERKIQDFIRLLNEFWLQEYVSSGRTRKLKVTREVSPESRHSSFSSVSNDESFQHKYEKLVELFELYTNGNYLLSNKDIFPQELLWVTTLEYDNYHKFGRGKVFAEAMAFYTNFLSVLEQQRTNTNFRQLTRSELLLLRSFKQNAYFKPYYTDALPRKSITGALSFEPEEAMVRNSRNIPVAQARAINNNIIPMADAVIAPLSNSSNYGEVDPLLVSAEDQPSAPPFEEMYAPSAPPQPSGSLLLSSSVLFSSKQMNSESNRFENNLAMLNDFEPEDLVSSEFSM